mmetsp:Transcript_59541/g.172440  ORF Transcript_59541/g.172440 Transcript_59541/m.172440 type:complete len:262 (+) Transcript_59541:64-849(+)
MWRGHSAMSSTHERRVVQSPVDVFLVFVDPRAPRKVRLHASPLHGLEDIRLAVESVQGLVAHLLVFVNVQGQDAETRGLLLGLNDDGVLQAATQCDDGDAAIPLGAHLRQAARLVPRRHQEEVAPGVQHVLELRVELAGGHATPPLVGLLVHLLHEVLVAVAGQQHLHSAGDVVACVDHHPVQTLENQVNALLRCQTAYERHHHHVRVLLQPDLLLQLQLAGTLAFNEISLVVVLREERVGPRVPCDHVDAVQDPGQKELL